MVQRFSSPILILIGGDILALALVTIAGFASHGELGSAGMRMLTTFVPLGLAWALTAPWMGLYDLSTTRQPRQLYKPVLAALLAAPMAGWLRGLWLNRPIIPIFIGVLAASTALAIVLWRAIWLFIQTKQVTHGRTGINPGRPER